jgi:type II secretory ATPase GspE/PulE/Tfp pilus assembly ATPase PilB-like protein
MDSILPEKIQETLVAYLLNNANQLRGIEELLGGPEKSRQCAHITPTPMAGLLLLTV